MKFPDFSNFQISSGKIFIFPEILGNPRLHSAETPFKSIYGWTLKSPDQIEQTFIQLHIQSNMVKGFAASI